MTQNNNNLKALNESWKSGALDSFIKRMLIYFDPMDLIVAGAPYDEYDADIAKIKEVILQKEITEDKLSDYIFNLYKSDGGIIDDVKKKSERMAKDLIDLKNS